MEDVKIPAEMVEKKAAEANSGADIDTGSVVDTVVDVVSDAVTAVVGAVVDAITGD